MFRLQASFLASRQSLVEDGIGSESPCEPFSGGAGGFENSEVGAGVFFGHQVVEACTEFHGSGRAHDRQADSIIPQLLEDGTGFARTQVKEIRGEVGRKEQGCGGAMGEACLDHERGVIRGAHEARIRFGFKEARAGRGHDFPVHGQRPASR